MQTSHYRNSFDDFALEFLNKANQNRISRYKEPLTHKKKKTDETFKTLNFVSFVSTREALVVSVKINTLKSCNSLLKDPIVIQSDTVLKSIYRN